MTALLIVLGVIGYTFVGWVAFIVACALESKESHLADPLDSVLIALIWPILGPVALSVLIARPLGRRLAALTLHLIHFLNPNKTTWSK